MKKLAGLRTSDTDRFKKHQKSKRGKLNNPYPESGFVGNTERYNHTQSAYSFRTQQTGNASIGYSVRGSGELALPTVGGRSTAGTFSSENERPRSLTAPSHGESSLAGTSRTVGGGMESRRGGDSTFSSPAPSEHSLATTLTTIQSMGPNGHAPPQTHHHTQSIQFSQPFPTTSPASAIPAHLAPTAPPTTYTTATANNLLTDNASILTLASSSKRRRRRSMDTDASVRALAPSSLWGGSRESLPLSVLSSNVEVATPGVQGSSRLGVDRNSMYSTTGATSTLAGERSSVYNKQGDAASVRSGLIGHGRPDSISGSIAGVAAPWASSLEAPGEKQPSVDQRSIREAKEK